MVNLQEMDGFDENIALLHKFFNMRKEPLELLGQRYITEDSLLSRISILIERGMLKGRRVMSIGDDDLSGLACAIFGEPIEVLIVDIDKRLSEILFEANIEYNLDVRFLYHDMRIKMIEVLRKQYSLILIEPPWTEAGMEVFISRSIECLAPGFEDGIFISVPHSGPIREYFNEYARSNQFEILEEFPMLNKFKNTEGVSDFLHLKVPEDAKPTHVSHWLDAFYEHEVNKIEKPYRCRCENIITVGPEEAFKSLSELTASGCPNCGAKLFVYASKVKME